VKTAVNKNGIFFFELLKLIQIFKIFKFGKVLKSTYETLKTYKLREWYVSESVNYNAINNIK